VKQSAQSSRPSAQATPERGSKGPISAAQAPLTLANTGTSGGENSNLPHCSQCDLSMIAEAAIDYYGTGAALVTWKVDNISVGQQQITLPPSKGRHNLGADPKSWPAIIVDTMSGVYSPSLPHKELGEHLVSVEIAAIKNDSAA
jgi:hypothetical protein